MRVGLDATPLLGPRTGVGRYTDRLLRALCAGEGGEQWVATAFTARRAGALRDLVPPQVAVRARRMPARLLRQVWQRAEFPPVSWSAGPLDVFHATNFVLPPAGRAAGVVTVHDLSFLRTRDAVAGPSLAYRELVPRSIARAAVVLTPSTAVAEELVAEYRVDPASVRVTHLGVDESWLATGAPPRAWLHARGLPTDYVVAVGVLEPRKGLQTLLDAFAALADDPDAPHLVLVGPKGWGPQLRLGRHAADRVHLAGYLADPDLRRVVAGSRGLAFPTRYEGFGLPPLEALACGRPVSVSDLPVTREVLGPHATYVPVGDVDGWAAALQRLGADDGNDRAADRRRHAAQFSWQRCAERTRQAYAAAVRHPGA